MRYYVNEGSSAYSPVLSQCDEEVHWFHGDALGSTVGLTDASGGQTDTFLYEAFGTSLGRTGATETPYQFVGGYGYFKEASAGLEQVWWRWLLTPNGRWASGDVRGRAVGTAHMNDLVEMLYGQIRTGHYWYPVSRFGRDSYAFGQNAPTYVSDFDGRLPVVVIAVIVVAAGEALCIGYAVTEAIAVGRKERDKLAHCVASCILMPCGLGLGGLAWVLGWIKELYDWGRGAGVDQSDVRANEIGRECWRCRESKGDFRGLPQRETCEECCNRML